MLYLINTLVLLKDFEVPLYLDAKACGLQHLACLSDDQELYNIGTMEDPYKYYLNSCLQGKLTREEVKQIVMCIPYGITEYGIRKIMNHEQWVEYKNYLKPTLKHLMTCRKSIEERYQYTWKTNGSVRSRATVF